MAFLEIGGNRHALPVGECVIGADATATIALPDPGVRSRHAVIKVHSDGQVVVRKADNDAVILVNGVRLGPNPTPLLHGDKLTLGESELFFVDERKSGSTQYVQAVDPAALAGMMKPAGKKGAKTAGTGGRLVSLTDGREYSLSEGSFLIGRDATCDVVLVSKSVSRRHADIMTTPKGYVLVDCSTNGTLVNGQRVNGQQVLARGDIIQCGEHEFRFYADLAPVEAPASASPLQVGTPSAAAPASAPPAAAPPPAPPPPAPEPAGVAPPGAVNRLSNTLHGVPSVPRATPAGQAGVGMRTGEGRVAPAPGKTGEVTSIANIIVRSGPLKGQRFPIRVPIVNVGRAEYNDVVIADDSVSTTHAKIQRREGIWVMIDLDSTNGTMVDGERVSNGEVPLAPGALIRFGNVQCVFEPTDDTIDAPKGSSTRLLSAVRPEDMQGRRGGK